MTHPDGALWVRNAPCIDFVAENEKARGTSGRGNLSIEPDVVSQMAEFPDQYISEVNHSKPAVGKEDLVGVNHPADNACAEKMTHAMRRGSN